MANATVGYYLSIGRRIQHSGQRSGAGAKYYNAIPRVRIPFVGVANGNYKLVGQVVVYGVGYRSVVELSPAFAPGLCLQLKDTDASGNFTLYGIDGTKTYIVIAWDRSRTYRIKGQSNIVPVPM